MRREYLERLAVLLACGGMLMGSDAWAAGWGKSRQACQTCEPCETSIIEAMPHAESEVAPQEPGDMAEPPAPAQPEMDSAFDQALTGQYDVASTSNMPAPNMIGDFFGGGGVSYVPAFIPNSDGDPNDFVYDSNYDIVGLGPNAIAQNLSISPGTGGGVGRIKLAENTSILPQDRVFFGYQFFDSVPLAGNGTDVNRFLPGFEKTFFGGTTSVEVRIPFAATLDSTQNLDALGSTNTELGNVTLFFKTLLYSSNTTAIGAGLTVTTPTANDLVAVDRFGVTQFRVENEGTHLAPYIGAIWMPGRLFTQLYFQYDADATGRSVLMQNPNSTGLSNYGKFTDTSVAFLDWNVGYWLYRNPGGDSLITGIAPVFEVHYNQALGNGDFITNNSSVIADLNDSYSIVNLTLGSHFVLGQRSTLTLAMGLPVTDGNDRQFDYEFHVLFNYLFGQLNRFSTLPRNF